MFPRYPRKFSWGFGTYQGLHEGAQFLRDHREFEKRRADVRFLFLQRGVAESLQRSSQVHLVVHVGCEKKSGPVNRAELMIVKYRGNESLLRSLVFLEKFRGSTLW